VTAFPIGPSDCDKLCRTKLPQLFDCGLYEPRTDPSPSHGARDGNAFYEAHLLELEFWRCRFYGGDHVFGNALKKRLVVDAFCRKRTNDSVVMQSDKGRLVLGCRQERSQVIAIHIPRSETIAEN
jgi:hypothetical protein